MSYTNDVSVIVEDNCVKVVGYDGEIDTIVFLKSDGDKLGKSKIVDNRNYNSPQNDTIIFKDETYIERMYEMAVKEIEQMDKRIVAESFRKDVYLDKIKGYTFSEFFKDNFRKSKKD
jgi:hypothetical protein